MDMRSTFASLALLLCTTAAALADGFIIIPNPPERPHHPRHHAFAPLEVRTHHVEVKIDGQIATTSVDQEFYNPNDRALEGIYMFPIPKTAHIDKFSMEIGGEQVEAELLDADKARGIYEDIVRRMKDPALLEYGDRKAFKVRIFPLEPRKVKRVQLTYTELLRSDAGAISYTYPLSTEKFSAVPVRSVSVKIHLATEQPLASIYSPSHTVEIERDGARKAVVGWEESDVKPDTDFQLVYAQETGDVGLTLLTHRDADGDGYFMLLAAPAPDQTGKKPAPKDVAFVVDTSGSMSGGKLAQAKKALEFCVENLGEEDRFEIVRFSTEAEQLFDKLAPADEKHRARAMKFIGGLKPIGGTAIEAALKAALKLQPEESDRPFVVIFMTDGIPTVGSKDVDQLLSGVRKAARGTRVFSFGIGSNVNTHLLDQLAEATRAFSTYVLPKEDLEVKLSSFFTRIKEPAMTSLALAFDGGMSVSKMYPAELPDLFQGDQLVLTGRYEGSGKAEAKLTGKIAGEERALSYPVEFTDSDASREFIPRLWATRRVGYLLDEIRHNGESAELREEIVELARKFAIVTPYTSYLIVEDEKKRDVPMPQRSAMPLSAPASRAVSGAFSSLGGRTAGVDAVADARAQNALKFADKAEAGARSADAEVARGVAAVSGGTFRADEARQQAQFVNGRAFYQNGSRWVDAQSQSLAAEKRQRVQFGSDEYFALLASHPAAGPWLAVSQNVTLTLNDVVYEIHE